MPSWARAALTALAGLLALLVLAQIVLPPLAERRLRDRLERNGSVERVEIRAFPALELLWHHADEVRVRMSEGRAATGRFADLMASTRDTDRLDAVVESLRIILLRFSDLTLRKREDVLTGTATVTDADLRAALPDGFDVRPVASGDGALVFEGTADVLGRRFGGQVVAAARNGRVLLAPNVPFGGFLAITVFEDPRIEVLSVGARQRPGGGFVLTARARLRD